MRIALGALFSFWSGQFSDSGVVPVIIFGQARHLDSQLDGILVRTFLTYFSCIIALVEVLIFSDLIEIGTKHVFYHQE